MTASAVDVLTEAVRRAPDDTTAARALTDALMEAGAKPLTARRAVAVIVRVASAAKALADAERAVNGGTAKSAKLRSLIRREAGAGSHRPPIEVIAGDDAPALTGEAPRTVFRGGGWCRSPWSALARGYRVQYRASSLAVTVGVMWVLAHHGPSAGGW